MDKQGNDRVCHTWQGSECFQECLDWAKCEYVGVPGFHGKCASAWGWWFIWREGKTKAELIRELSRRKAGIVARGIGVNLIHRQWDGSVDPFTGCVGKAVKHTIGRMVWQNEGRQKRVERLTQVHTERDGGLDPVGAESRETSQRKSQRLTQMDCGVC